LLKDQLNSVADQYCYQNLRIQEFNRILSEMAHQHPLCQILLSIPGIGPINATPIYSAIGNGAQFNSGRQFAVWSDLASANRAVVISSPVTALPNEATAIFANNWTMARELSYFVAKVKRTR
jgi:hypothetical protein